MSFDASWTEHKLLSQHLDENVQDIWLTNLAFLDDVYFTATSLLHGQQMLEEALALFGRIGLKPNLTKI